MSGREDLSRFAQIGYEDFRRLAVDNSLSNYQKIGFPDSYREGREAAIFDDIVAKVPAFRREGAVVLDIGCGCSDLPRMLLRNAAALAQELHLVDSEEMLAQLGDIGNATATACYYPDCSSLIERLRGRVDGAVAYSVAQYVFAEGNIWNFLDTTLELLAPGGRFLIGDLPNVSMRKRFFASDTGRLHHRQFTGQNQDPEVRHCVVEPGQLDDAAVLSLLLRARNAGFQAFVVPQPESLPMHNRREDILIVRP